MTIEQAKIYAKLSDEELNKLGIKAPKAMRAFADGKKIKYKVWDKLEKEYRVFRDNAPDFKGGEEDYIIVEEEKENFSVSISLLGATITTVDLVKNPAVVKIGNSFPSKEAAQKRAEFINWLLFKADENVIRMLFTFPPPKIEVIPKNLTGAGIIAAFHDTAAEMIKNEEEF